MGTALSLPDKA